MFGASRWLDPMLAQGSVAAIAAATVQYFLNDMMFPLVTNSREWTRQGIRGAAGPDAWITPAKRIFLRVHPVACGVRKVIFGRMPAQTPAKKLTALARLIGGTPLLEIHCRYRGREQRIYAKHEAYNFTGSIKDRMALYILQRAYASGEIGPGDVIAEATSGNTGISFAAIGRALGHPVRIYMPDWMSRERVLVIQSLGAAVIPVSAELGGFQGSIRMADDFAREGGRVSPAAVRQHRQCSGALRNNRT